MGLCVVMRSVRIKVDNAPKEVPEPGLGDNIIGRKDTHTEDFGRGLRLCRQVAAHDLVFGEASHLPGNTKEDPVSERPTKSISHPKSSRRIQPLLRHFLSSIQLDPRRRCGRLTSIVSERIGETHDGVLEGGCLRMGLVEGAIKESLPSGLHQNLTQNLQLNKIGAKGDW